MSHLRIGFAYDDITLAREVLDGNPVTAEYEDTRAIDWIRKTLERWGLVIDLPFSVEIPEKILKGSPDIIFNITEAYGGRNRESLVPAVAQTLGIPLYPLYNMQNRLS